MEHLTKVCEAHRGLVVQRLKHSHPVVYDPEVVERNILEWRQNARLRDSSVEDSFQAARNEAEKKYGVSMSIDSALGIREYVNRQERHRKRAKKKADQCEKILSEN